MNTSEKPALSLRRILRSRIEWLVFSAVAMVSAGFFFLAFQPMLERLAESHFVLAAEELTTRLNGVFGPTEQVLSMSPGWIGGEAPSLDDPGDFNRIFQPVLQVLPQATSVVSGASSGEGWMLLLNPDGSFMNRMTDLKHWGNRHLLFTWDIRGNSEKVWKSFDYDPRQRSWYLASASKQGGVQWTGPYPFFTTGDPGITASMHFVLKDGRDFVIGIDLKLTDLSLTTSMATHVGKRGMALVLTEDRRVLALPAAPVDSDQAVWLGNILKRGDELGIPALTHALANWRPGNGGEVISYSADGETWLACMHLYRLGEHSLWLLTLAPKADFSPDWIMIAGIFLAGLTLLLIAVVFFSHWLAGRIANPLERVVAASERIGQLDFDDFPLQDNGNIAEMRFLTVSHEKMRALLQNNQQQLAQQEHDLREQIATLRATEERLRESEAHFRTLSENASDVIWQLDSHYVYTYLSPADKRIRGFCSEELIGRSVLDTMTEESVKCTQEKMQQRLLDEQRGIQTGAMLLISQHRCKNGALIWTETLVTPERDAQGEICGYHGISRDITERRAAEDALRASESRFFTLLENVDACIYLKDTEGRYIFANRAVRDLWQVTEMSEVTGFSDEKFFSAESAARLREIDRRVLDYGETVRVEETNTVSATGKTLVFQATKLPLRRDDGSIYALCGISSDITALKDHEQQLKRIAHYDPLTTLPNRVLLADRLQQAMNQAVRRKQRLAVAYLDLDGFKKINDRYGHETGDQLLIALAQAMRGSLREGDTLARLGGDEFIAVLIDLYDAPASLPLVSRLLAAAAQPVTIGDLTLQVSVSLGVTFYPQAEDVDADQLLR